MKTSGLFNRKKDIFITVAIPVLVLLIIQLFLFAGVFLGFGFVRMLRQNAMDLLQEHTANRFAYLENQFIRRWSSIDENERQIQDTIDRVLAEQGKSYAAISEDSQLNISLLSANVDNLIYMLRKTEVTDVFLILEGPGYQTGGNQESKAGIAIRDFDPQTHAQSNKDLLLELGAPSISKEHNLALDSFWSADLIMQDKEWATSAIDAAKAAGNVNATSAIDFAYWSEPIKLESRDQMEIITYSVPLVGTDGTVYGILGIGVSKDYMASELKSKELLGNNQGSYILGRLNADGTSVMPSLYQGTAYHQYFNNDTPLILGENHGGSVYSIESQKNNTELYASVHHFNLYDNNSPFEDEQWVLLSVVPKNELFDFSDRIEQVMAIFIIITGLIGIIGAIYTSRRMTAPLAKVINMLNASNPSARILLQKTGIKEIDELSQTIESLSSQVAASTSRMAHVLTMTGAKIGVFEYRLGDSKAYCSTAVLSMLQNAPADGNDEFIDTEKFIELLEKLKNQIYDKEEDIYYWDRGNELLYLQLKTIMMDDSLLGTIIDISADIRDKIRLEFERNHDALTSLWNIRAFKEMMVKALAAPEVIKVAGMVMWDLDNLKFINDIYGHEYGDRYICAFAKTLRRVEDYGGIAVRRSGDEFLVFLSGYDTEDEIRSIIDRVWKEITDTRIFLSDGKQQRIRVSAGIAWYPRQSDTYETLVQYADFAMYRSKHLRKGTLLEFDEESYAKESILMTAQESLNQLLDGEMVHFAYQPILDIKAKNIFGYELLMRSNHPAFKSPSDIIHVAKSQSKLYRIERLTWFGALASVRDKMNNNQLTASHKVLINSVANEKLTKNQWASIEEQYRDILPNVVMEITEGEPLSSKLTESKREEISRHGGWLAVDDFGSGHNSESVLLEIHPDLVKLDIALIRDLDLQKEKYELVSSMTKYAESNNIRVLAEGVETTGELKALLDIGVSYIQGYLVGRPEYEPQKEVPENVMDILIAHENL